MPSDTVCLMVTTGIGVSVVAGFISGVFYFLTQGLKTQRRRNKAIVQWHCAVCGNYLRSIEGVLEGDRIVTCTQCERSVCKTKCSNKDQEKGAGWICKSCQIPWYQEILNIFPGYKDLIKLGFTMDSNGLSEVDEDVETLRKREKEQIRDFIEHLVETMVGGSVDDACVKKLYNDKQYDALFERYHEDLINALTDLSSALHISIANLPLTGQSPCTAHAALKEIIKKLLKDALSLPHLQQIQHESSHQQGKLSDDTTSRTYEDLLATAILNKVISNCQNNLPCSSAASLSSRQSTSSKTKEEKEYFFGEETLDIKYKNTDPESTSISSLEEWISSDHSIGSTKYVDRVSLTIQQRIEEVTPITDSDENEEDDSEYFRTGSSLLADDDTNWYLQKRQFHGTHSPVPVPMLVPNPTNEAKVLIGDKEIDETSDLSDVASDYGDTESVAAPGVKSLLIESKMVIGGKNIIDGIHLSDAELSADSGVREDRGEDEDDHIKDDYHHHKPKTDISLDDENVEDASLTSTYSNTEKDTEYTERYASLPRTISKPIKSVPNMENDEEGPIFEGYYSKKEREKWSHPIELKNNPYSKENIEKRIKNGKIYGSDYYIRQASLPAGTRKLNNDEDQDLNEWQSNYETHHAKPTYIDSDEEIKPKILEKTSIENDLNVVELNSDSDMSLVNCYDVENSKIFQQSPNGNKKEIKITVNTEGLLYNPKNEDDLDAHTVQNNDLVSKGFEPEEILEEKRPERKILLETPPDTPKSVVKETGFNEPIDVERDENFNVEKPQLKVDLNQPKKIESPPVVIHKKSDNTLIKKIYADPVVRSFALTSRDQIPVNVTPIKTPTTPKFEELPVNSPTAFNSTKMENLKRTTSVPLDEIEEIKLKSLTKSNLLKLTSPYPEISEENFSLELSDEETTVPLQKTPTIIINKDPEICVLQEKKIVANRLGEFSKSFPNLTRMGSLQNLNGNATLPKNNNKMNGSNHYKKEKNSISVRDLRKLFESNNNSHKPIHSLTARSLSKPMREKLKSEENLEFAVSLSPKFSNQEEYFEFHAVDKIKFYENLK